MKAALTISARGITKKTMRIEYAMSIWIAVIASSSLLRALTSSLAPIVELSLYPNEGQLR
jgi:hypothetical protein